ncbi:hypothetical protein [Paenibacillus taichungensis]
MATIIRKVESHFVEVPVTGVICGCGNHNPYGKEETPCHCGDTMYPVLPGITEPQLVKGFVEVSCNCGRKVQCSGMTTTCKCGRDYNWNGDLLASREQWGEETGEHWTAGY